MYVKCLIDSCLVWEINANGVLQRHLEAILHNCILQLFIYDHDGEQRLEEWASSYVEEFR